MSADLGAIRARLAAATPGPWEQRQRGTWAPEVAAPNILTPHGDHAPYSPAAVVSRGEFNGNLADLDLIANAPADLAALCDEVEALRAAVERVREVHQPRKVRERLPNGTSIPWEACSCGCPSHSGCFTVQALRALDGAE